MQSVGQKIIPQVYEKLPTIGYVLKRGTKFATAGASLPPPTPSNVNLPHILPEHLMNVSSNVKKAVDYLKNANVKYIH